KASSSLRKRMVGNDSNYGGKVQINSFYSNFHNFLANSPQMLLNIVPNENGDILIENVNLKDYSHIHLVAIDERSVTEENHNSNSSAINKRSLTLTKSLDADKTYSELRNIEL